MIDKKEKSHKTIFIDLGQFGKFSKSTLMKNIKEYHKRYSDDNKTYYTIPDFIDEAFSKREKELVEYIDGLDNKQKIHWRIGDIRTIIFAIDNAQKELDEIKRLREKVEKVVNSK